MICDNCKIQQSRPCTYTARTREVYKAIMPALRMIARRCGYALTVHGSLKTDIDLVACPWREFAVDAQTLADDIQEAIRVIVGIARIREGDKCPQEMPCGRLAWSFYVTLEGQEHYGPYIDLSIMPIIKSENEQ